MALSDNGFNPIRWDCEKSGCFNLKCRPKIEVFSDCFPGRINFGDVDGIVEINSHALMLEWKFRKDKIPTGQRIMYERLSAKGLTVINVVGNAETMEVTHYGFFYQGKQHPYREANLSDVKQFMKRWTKHAKEPLE